MRSRREAFYGCGYCWHGRSDTVMSPSPAIAPNAPRAKPKGVRGRRCNGFLNTGAIDRLKLRDEQGEQRHDDDARRDDRAERELQEACLRGH